MEQQSIQKNLQEKFQNELVSFDETSDMLTFTVDKQFIVPVIQFLKEDLEFKFLTDLCGIHYPDQALPLGVIYHLHNFKTNTRIRVKTFTSIEQPEIDSMTTLFSSANWMERETFDFFGIVFIGHPNLIRILNVEYMDYFPMRKEYPLEDQTRKDKDDSFFGR
ncbi:MAG: NADH-quinone oxidoreductase subunit C [Prolixibacteraceae bacterium]|nr:NADH-quinone oxidoreductase subunit C [Prolixibacteraceae bacterium]